MDQHHQMFSVRLRLLHCNYLIDINIFEYSNVINKFIYNLFRPSITNSYAVIDKVFIFNCWIYDSLLLNLLWFTILWISIIWNIT